MTPLARKKTRPVKTAHPARSDFLRQLLTNYFGRIKMHDEAGWMPWENDEGGTMKEER
jgi:hypothetical protein